MSWFTIQTLPSILLALALGLLLGSLIWARRWEQTRTTRRDVLGHLVFTHRRELTDRDSRLEILRQQLDDERRESADVLAQLRQELATARTGSAAPSVGGPSTESPPTGLPPTPRPVKRSNG